MAAVQGGRDVPLCRWGRGKMAWREIPLIYLEGHRKRQIYFTYQQKRIWEASVTW